MLGVIGLWADRTDLPETDAHIRALRDGSNRTARLGFPIGIAKGDSLVPEGDAWWVPMSHASKPTNGSNRMASAKRNTVLRLNRPIMKSAYDEKQDTTRRPR